MLKKYNQDKAMQKQKKLNKYVVSYRYTNKKRLVIPVDTIIKLVKEAKEARKKPLMLYDVEIDNKVIKLEIQIKEA